MIYTLDRRGDNNRYDQPSLLYLFIGLKTGPIVVIPGALSTFNRL
jgi:hypothetical protein